jgi:hypothetical protein
MNRNGRTAEPLLKHRRQQVLTGVLLHVVESARPIDATMHRARLQFAIDDVNDLIALIADIEHVGIIKLAAIKRLTA